MEMQKTCGNMSTPAQKCFNLREMRNLRNDAYLICEVFVKGEGAFAELPGSAKA